MYLSVFPSGLKHREHETTICDCSKGFVSKYIGLEFL